MGRDWILGLVEVSSSSAAAAAAASGPAAAAHSKPAAPSRPSVKAVAAPGGGYVPPPLELPPSSPPRGTADANADPLLGLAVSHSGSLGPAASAEPAPVKRDEPPLL